MNFIKKLFRKKPREPRFTHFDNVIFNNEPIKITGIKRNYYRNDEFVGYEYRKINWNGVELEDSFFNREEFLDKDLEHELKPLPRLRVFERRKFSSEELSPNGIVLKVDFQIKVESQKTPIKLTVEPKTIKKVERLDPLSYNYDSEYFVSWLQEIEINEGNINLRLDDPETLALSLLKEKHNRIIKPEKVLEVRYKVKTRPQYRTLDQIYYEEVNKIELSGNSR